MYFEQINDVLIPTITIVRSPEHARLLNQQLPSMGKGKSEPLRVRVLVEGDGSVGKSTLTIRYVQDVFVDAYDPTIEDSYLASRLVDGNELRIEILDTGIGP